MNQDGKKERRKGTEKGTEKGVRLRKLIFESQRSPITRRHTTRQQSRHAVCFLLRLRSVRWIAVGPGGRPARQGCRAEGGGDRPRRRPRSLPLTSWRPPWSAPALRSAHRAAANASTAAEPAGRRRAPLRSGPRLRSLSLPPWGPHGPPLCETAGSPRSAGAASPRAKNTRPGPRRCASLLASCAPLSRLHGRRRFRCAPPSLLPIFL